jgi:hypothetical protein
MSFEKFNHMLIEYGIETIIILSRCMPCFISMHGVVINRLLRRKEINV